MAKRRKRFQEDWSFLATAASTTKANFLAATSREPCGIFFRIFTAYLFGRRCRSLLPGLVKRVLAVPYPMVIVRHWRGSRAGSTVVNWAVGSNQSSLRKCKNSLTHQTCCTRVILCEICVCVGSGLESRIEFQTIGRMRPLSIFLLCV